MAPPTAPDIWYEFLDELLKSTHVFSFFVVPLNANPILQLIVLVAIFFFLSHVSGPYVAVLMPLLYAVVKIFPTLEQYFIVRWYTEELIIAGFGDTKTGKTSLLKKFNQVGNLIWWSDICPQGSRRYRSLEAGYVWHGGRERNEPVRRTIIDSNADVFATSESHDMIPFDPDVVLLIFSITNRSSFESISSLWYNGLRDRNVQAPIVLVGTNVDQREYIDLDSYLDQGVNNINLQDFVTRKEGMDLMRKIGAISYIEYSDRCQNGRSDLLYKTTQAGLFYKRNQSIWLRLAKRFWNTVPTAPPPPPLLSSIFPVSPSIVHLGPITLRGGHDRARYGCLRNSQRGVRIYFYIKCYTRRAPHSMFVLIIVVQEADLSQINMEEEELGPDHWISFEDRRSEDQREERMLFDEEDLPRISLADRRFEDQWMEGRIDVEELGPDDHWMEAMLMDMDEDELTQESNQRRISFEDQRSADQWMEGRLDEYW